MTITIRRTEPEDYAGVQRIFAGPQVVWGTLQLPHPSAEVWRKRLADMPDTKYGLVACSGDEIVGQLDIHMLTNPRRRHAGQLGMAVRDDMQGRGIGAALMQAGLNAADNWLNLLRLELEVFVDNERAVRLYTRFGFVIEGVLVQYAFRDGQYIDVYKMARLRPPRV
jgi:putative acetyltransferase